MTFESLVQEIADPSQHVATAKLVGLSSMEADDATSFARMWHGLDDPRRLRLARDLVELAEDNVEANFDRVFFIALDDSSPEVRREAIHGLWEHEDRDLIDPLIRLLHDDPDAGVRAQAALALGRFVLQGELATLRRSDAERVEHALRQTYHDPTEPIEVRSRALEALGARGAEWVRDLIDDAFSSDDRRLRISAVHAMGRSADTAWLSSVLAQLDDDDAEMRFEAATAAGSIGDPDAVPLMLALLHDEDIEVRVATVGALGQIGGGDAKDALQELLTEGDEALADIITSTLAEIDFAEDPLAFQLQE